MVSLGKGFNIEAEIVALLNVISTIRQLIPVVMFLPNKTKLFTSYDFRRHNIRPYILYQKEKRYILIG